jgi:raffinose/stachyose/melibiose transport system substrate-binding protein
MKMTQFIMVLIIFFFAASGCAGGDTVNQSVVPSVEEDESGWKGSIKVYTNRVDLIENGMMQQYAEPFMKEHTGAQVKFEGLTNYTSDILFDFTGEDADVLLIPNNVSGVELENYLEPLEDEVFQDILFENFVSHNGKRYGVSMGSSTDGIVYNKQAFREAGITEVPRTLDAFYEACEKLKLAGITPIYMNYGAQWPMKQWGENLLNFMTGDSSYLNTMVQIDEPWQLDNAWGQAVQIAKTLVSQGYTEKDLLMNNWESSKAEIASGRAAMALSGNWLVKQVIAAGADSDDVGFFPFPYDNESTEHYAPLNPDWFIGVSKLSKHKELAEAWIAYFVKDSGYVDDSGFMPVKVGQQSKLPQLQEFMSYNPILIESKPPSIQFLGIANKAGLFFWSGELLQELVASQDLNAQFQILNAKWKQAKLEQTGQ